MSDTHVCIFSECNSESIRKKHGLNINDNNSSGIVDAN